MKIIQYNTTERRPVDRACRQLLRCLVELAGATKIVQHVDSAMHTVDTSGGVCYFNHSMGSGIRTWQRVVSGTTSLYSWAFGQNRSGDTNNIILYELYNSSYHFLQAHAMYLMMFRGLPYLQIVHQVNGNNRIQLMTWLEIR